MSELRNRKFEQTRQPQTQGKNYPPSVGLRGGMDWIRRQPLWIVLAVASGTCAAINGVFAKLLVAIVRESVWKLTVEQGPPPP